MTLKDKVAVIYGGGGAIGGAVARAFARQGAKLFLTGRRRAPVEVVAKDVVSAGGSAKAAEVDALDEQAVDKHLQSVIDQAGRVDISFNAVGIPYCLPYMRNTEYYDPSCYSGGALDLAPGRGVAFARETATPCGREHGDGLP